LGGGACCRAPTRADPWPQIANDLFCGANIFLWGALLGDPIMFILGPKQFVVGHIFVYFWYPNGLWKAAMCLCWVPHICFWNAIIVVWESFQIILGPQAYSRRRTNKPNMSCLGQTSFCVAPLGCFLRDHRTC